MSELEEKLENILGNPQAMSQIMALAQSLNLGGQGGGGQGQAQPQEQSQGGGGQGQTQSQEQNQGREGGQPPAQEAPVQIGEAPAPPVPPAASAGSGGGLEGMLGALNNLDVGTLSAAANLIGQFSGGNDDKRTALLTALRPFVREERYAKLDKAIQIAKLSRLIRSGLDLFRQRKEDGHV